MVDQRPFVAKLGDGPFDLRVGAERRPRLPDLVQHGLDIPGHAAEAAVEAAEDVLVDPPALRGEELPGEREVAVAGDHVEIQDLGGLVERAPRHHEHLGHQVPARPGEHEHDPRDELHVAAQQRLDALLGVFPHLLELVDGHDDPAPARLEVVEHLLERGLGVGRGDVEGELDRAVGLGRGRRAAALEEPPDDGDGLLHGGVERTEHGGGEGPGESGQVARRVDVEVDAGAVGRQAGERVADETRLSVAARGDERDVAVVLDRTEQLFGLLDAIAEVFRTGVAGGQKGVFELHEGESTTTPT